MLLGLQLKPALPVGRFTPPSWAAISLYLCPERVQDVSNGSFLSSQLHVPFGYSLHLSLPQEVSKCSLGLQASPALAPKRISMLSWPQSLPQLQLPRGRLLHLPLSLHGSLSISHCLLWLQFPPPPSVRLGCSFHLPLHKKFVSATLAAMSLYLCPRKAETAVLVSHLEQLVMLFRLTCSFQHFCLAACYTEPKPK